MAFDWRSSCFKDGHVEPTSTVYDRYLAVPCLGILMWDGSHLVKRGKKLLYNFTLHMKNIRYSGATEEHRIRLTASGAAPILDDIQAYFAGSMTPVPRRPGMSQLWSSQKKSASESREKTSDGRLFMSISLCTSAKPQIKR